MFVFLFVCLFLVKADQPTKRKRRKITTKKIHFSCVHDFESRVGALSCVSTDKRSEYMCKEPAVGNLSAGQRAGGGNTPQQQDTKELIKAMSCCHYTVYIWHFCHTAVTSLQLRKHTLKVLLLSISQPPMSQSGLWFHYGTTLSCLCNNFKQDSSSGCATLSRIKQTLPFCSFSQTRTHFHN